MTKLTLPKYLISILIFLVFAINVEAQVANNQFIIKFKEGTPLDVIAALKQSFNPTDLQSIPSIEAELWEVPNTQVQVNGQTLNNMKGFLGYLKTLNYVEYIEQNFLFSLDYTPNDPYFNELWGMNNTGQTFGVADADIDAVEAWDIVKESPDVVTAIVDTGIDWRHPDLVNNIWQNLGEDADGDGKVLEWIGGQWVFDPGDENGVDDDGNGYPDDFVGWDFSDNDNDPYDYYGHGTHVAGTVGAEGGNGIGVAGVTHDVQMMAIKIFPNAFATTIVEGIQYAVDNGANISNNSYGSWSYSQAVYDVIRVADIAGHLFVASAGNDYLNNNDISPKFPCSYDLDNIISVASTTDADGISYFSNIGPTSVDLGAPGSSILSCVPNNGYDHKSGTSMAAPHVAGALSLLWGQGGFASHLELKDKLLTSVDPIPQLMNNCVSGGRLNLFQLFSDDGGSNPVCPTDSLVLVDLYNSTNGQNWSNTWNLNTPMSTWFGVTLNSDGCVVCLDLDGHNSCTNQPQMGGNNLTGTLPNSIGQLASLERLYLGENQIGGNIPSEIGNLSSLIDLVLTNNEFSDNIPFTLFNLSILETFGLAENNLTGTIPAQIGNLTNLKHIGLSHNQLTGMIPAGIGNLINLNLLHLHSNKLNGNIPSSLGNLTNLTSLQASDNLLSGCFPNELSSLCSINVNFTNNNSLPGGGDFQSFCLTGAGGCVAPPQSCPDSLILVDLYNSTNGQNWVYSWDLNLPISTWYGVTLNTDGCVTCLDLNGDSGGECGGSIAMGGNNLTGTLPASIGNLTNLERLYLNENPIGGTIPSALGNLSNLVELALTNNEYVGEIPLSLMSLPNIQLLHLAENNLTGTIPTQVGNLTNLTSFAVSHNNLSGEIPSSLGDLTSLTLLLLHSNDLSGSIPPSLGNLTNLTILQASDNLLSGCFPNELLTLCPIDPFFNYNPNLPGNGDFQAFCATGAGACNTPPQSCSDSLVLVDLYNFTNGQNWVQTWDLNAPMSTWYGVTLNSDGCVTCLDLNGGNNGGECGGMIAMGGNNLTGTLPASIGNLSSLERLYLNENPIGGTIPSELGNLSNIKILTLTNNNYVGEIPLSLMSLPNIELLHLAENNLTGEIPSQVGNLTNLTSFAVSHNQLTGEIPSSLGDLTSLTLLLLHSNDLSGSIPPSLGNLTNLTILQASDNLLSGCFPNELLTLCPIDPFFNYNPNLPGNGDFQAFCSTGAGACNTPPQSCSDSLVLVDLYNSTNGQNWVNTWDLNAPMSTWFGVTLNSDGCVVCLDLDGHNSCTNQPQMGGNNLAGTLPNSIGQLSSLEKIYLGENNIGGNIPTEVGDLSNLIHLVLTNNVFDGNIPLTLFNLTNLEIFSLAENNLSGNIPTQIENLTGLTHLGLSYNQLTGSIPSEVGNLVNLNLMHLHGNDLTGSIPSSLGNLTNLTGLHAYNNNLSGCFPNELSSLCPIMAIYFYDNPNLPGGGDFQAFCANGTGGCSTPPQSCPDSLVLVELYNSTNGPNWTNTWDLNQPMDNWYGVSLTQSGCVSALNLTDNNLVGELPTAIGNLVDLKNLFLNENNISGNIPSEIGGLESILRINLSGNNLTGDIPIEIGNLITIEFLYLGFNELTGEIPSTIGNLINLTFLNLQVNQLVGIIPEELGNLIFLKSLFLSNNQLTGEIPSTLGNLGSLKTLVIQVNQLSGSLPVELSNLINLEDFIVYTNQLSGCFPQEYEIFCSINYNFTNNLNLPGGGNFDDFCQNGNGACQPMQPCSVADSLVLVDFYNATDGPNWTVSWDLSLPMSTWNGVGVTFDGCVGALNLQNNNLVGTIPANIVNLSNLTNLWIPNNFLTGNLPTDIGELSSLIYLNIGSNELTGEIPSSIGNLTQLTYFALQNNALAGVVPTSIGDLTALTHILLRDNQLVGELPSTIGNLGELKTLKIDVNQLSGSLPVALSNCTELTSIRLNNNQFTGCFPQQYSVFCNITASFSNNPNLPGGGNFSDFCQNGSGACTNFTGTYPGDTNFDGVVNSLDVFSLGIKNGKVGTPRTNQTIVWDGLASSDWNDTTPDNIDAKHSDCDGDGSINFDADVLAIMENYNNTHAESFPLMSVIQTDAIIQAVPNNITVENNKYRFMFEIEIAEGANVLNDIYGIDFMMKYSSFTGTVGFDASDSFLGTEGQDLRMFEHEFQGEDSTNVALVRTDGENFSGTFIGEKLITAIIVEDNIPTGGNLSIQLSNINLTDNLGNIYKLQGRPTELFISTSTAPLSVGSDGILALSINATEVTCQGGATVTCLPIGGTAPYEYQWNTGQSTNVISNLEVGFHYVTVVDADGNFVAGEIEVKEKSPLMVALDIESDNGQGTGSISVNSINGGVGDFDLLWSTGETEMNISGLFAGTYYLTITDENGCEQIETIEIPIGIDDFYNNINTLLNVSGNVFPSLSRGAFNIEIDTPHTMEQTRLQVYNSLGQVVKDKTFFDIPIGKSLFSDEHLNYVPNGIYFVRLTHKGDIILNEQIRVMRE